MFSQSLANNIPGRRHAVWPHALTDRERGFGECYARLIVLCGFGGASAVTQTFHDHSQAGYTLTSIWQVSGGRMRWTEMKRRNTSRPAGRLTRSQVLRLQRRLHVGFTHTVSAAHHCKAPMLPYGIGKGHDTESLSLGRLGSVSVIKIAWMDHICKIICELLLSYTSCGHPVISHDQMTAATAALAAQSKPDHF